MNIYDILKDIITVKSGKLHTEPDFKKVWSSFMIARYLSMDSKFVNYGALVNKYQLIFMPEQMYLFLVKSIPQNRNSFIKYITKPKKKKISEEAQEED
jgi:hypothetical protein